MIIMAIDDSNAYVSRQHGAEFFNGAISRYHSVFPFITRLITHLCAPGFCFLMGAAVVWFAASRRGRGWTELQILQKLAARGFALFLVGQFLENPVVLAQSFLKGPAVRLATMSMPPPMDGLPSYWGFIKMSNLGVVMMACSVLLRFGVRVWAVAGVLCVAATNSLLPADGAVGPLWKTILLELGLSGHMVGVYPVIPWLGVAACGMCFGYWWKQRAGSSPALVSGLGLAMVGFAMLVRFAGGWGNLQLPRDNSWIEFLNNVKYPPSLVFWTLSVGVDLLLLAALMCLPGLYRSAKSPLMVFGQTPLFFYIVHLYLFAVTGFLFFREAAPLWVTYPVWLGGLILLYPVCAWYRQFKLAKAPESLWRMF